MGVIIFDDDTALDFVEQDGWSFHDHDPEALNITYSEDWRTRPKGRFEEFSEKI